MRYVEVRPELELGFDPDESQLNALSSWLTIQITDALAAQQPLQRVWRDSLRQYDGVPKNPVRNTPIVNSPNIEVTIGAIACDSIFAQATELIWSASPLLMVRPVGDNKEAAKDAEALQDFVNHVAMTEIDLRIAYDNATLDDVQLGTGVYYVPWVNWVKKTNTHMVKYSGPRAVCIPVEDFIIPSFSYSDLQQIRWVAARFWYTKADLAERADLNPNWNLEGVMPAANVDWVRQRREALAHTYQGIQRKGDIYEIIDVYCYYDIDDDGVAEDLYVTWDKTSRRVIQVSYNPYDIRPFEAMRFQQRAHLFYGIGIMEMLRYYQEEVSELHNQRTLNTIIANTRLWKARTGSVPQNFRIWPNRIVELDDPTSLQPEQLGDIYPSSSQAEAITISLAERRVGVNDVSIPRPSQVLGSRTPGITALSLLQQSSKRFTHSFDNIRCATAGVVRQALGRFSERILAADANAEDYIYNTMGAERAQRILNVLRRPDFQRQFVVELTASSASINREADRQSSMMLVQVLSEYYQKTLELVSVAASPQTPPQVREVAGRIAEAVGNVIERTIRTFDNVRDPQTFIVEVEDIVDNLQGLSQEGLSGLGQLLGQFAGASGQPGAGGAGDVGAGALGAGPGVGGPGA